VLGTLLGSPLGEIQLCRQPVLDVPAGEGGSDQMISRSLHPQPLCVCVRDYITFPAAYSGGIKRSEYFKINLI